MVRWVLAEAAAIGLEQLTDFLLERFLVDAVQTVDLNVDALKILEAHARTHRSPYWLWFA